MARPLLVLADLQLEAPDGQQVRVQGEGALLTVSLPGIRWALRYAAPLGRRAQRAGTGEAVRAALALSRVTLEVRVRSRVIARLAPRTGAPGRRRLFGAEGVEVFPLAILRSLVQR